MKTYSELITIPTFEERFEYLKVLGYVGDTIFGGHRYLNQNFYRSKEWQDLRNFIINRDNACDLAMPGYEMNSRIYIHHLNPITIDDILEMRSCVMDPENLVCVSFDMHNAIHYGTAPVDKRPVVRLPNDTCPWKH